MEYEFVEEDYSMEDQPDIVKDFFLLDPVFVGTDFCYNSAEIQQLVLGDTEEELYTWTSCTVDNEHGYLLLENSECYTSIELKTFVRDERKMAYLNQVSKSDQRVDFLEYDRNRNKWVRAAQIPRPELSAYFNNLSTTEDSLVNVYGYQYIYLKASSDTLTCLFSDWMTGMEIEAAGYEWNREADHEYAVVWDGKQFNLNQK